MTSIKQTLMEMDKEQLIKMVNEFEQLEEYGVIGKCILRDIADSLMKDAPAILSMQLITLEAYRQLYQNEKALNSILKDGL